MKEYALINTKYNILFKVTNPSFSKMSIHEASSKLQIKNKPYIITTGKKDLFLLRLIVKPINTNKKNDQNKIPSINNSSRLIDQYPFFFIKIVTNTNTL